MVRDETEREEMVREERVAEMDTEDSTTRSHLLPQLTSSLHSTEIDLRENSEDVVVSVVVVVSVPEMVMTTVLPEKEVSLPEKVVSALETVLQETVQDVMVMTDQEHLSDVKEMTTDHQEVRVVSEDVVDSVVEEDLPPVVEDPLELNLHKFIFAIHSQFPFLLLVKT